MVSQKHQSENLPAKHDSPQEDVQQFDHVCQIIDDLDPLYTDENNLHLEFFSISRNVHYVPTAEAVRKIQGDPTGTVANHIPVLSWDELLSDPELHGEYRRMNLGSADQKNMSAFITVRIVRYYEHRTEALEEMLVPVHNAELDRDRCNVCHDPLPEADAPGAVKLAYCGHIFGRECITIWLMENDTCPVCRDRVVLPVAYKLQIMVP